MAEYMNDDDQVEALKRWWKENGKSIIGGVVLGLVLVGGWQGWQRYTTGQAERASAYFTQFSQAVRGGDLAAARQQGERLIGEFGDATYGVLAALDLARLTYEAGEPAAARARLEWAMAQAGDPALEQLARLRLARLLLDEGKLDGAERLVGEPSSGAFSGEYAALRGDIASARGNAAAARRAYEEALAQGASAGELIRMKLTELGVAAAAG
ncbi:MAG: tetratricopeptide repeat protein [Gammaproteobacteria bacterium]